MYFEEKQNDNGTSSFEMIKEADLLPGDPPETPKKYHRRFITEWWGGVKIGANIYVKLRKLPFQFRDVENVGRAYGRYVGFAYNGMDKRPFSRVWATKDVQILYNLISNALKYTPSGGRVEIES